MKKSDIISTHNALLGDINAALAEYKTLTGEDYPNGDSLRIQLGSHTINWCKEFLEERLEHRQRMIVQVKQEADIYVKTKVLKSSEEGKAFIASLKKRQADILAELHQVSKEFVDSFDNLLADCGLEDWKVVNYKEDKTCMPHHLPSFSWMDFRLWKTNMRNTNLKLYIKNGSNGWELEVNTSLRGGCKVGQPNEEYYQNKAYVTIIDHSKAFKIWLDTYYQDIATRTYDLQEELNRADEAVRNPYEAWVRENS